MIAPDITIRNATSPYATISRVDYVQTKDDRAYNFPVKEGEVSDKVKFRVYNNWALNTGIAEASNVRITTYDSSVGYTASTLPISQAWVHVYETGFGQSAGTPAIYTQVTGLDTSVGGNSVYVPEVGSDGNTYSILRAGVNGNGVGFLEFESYMSVPKSAAFGTYNFVLSVDYVWTT